jgi:hypothetical protein
MAHLSDDEAVAKMGHPVVVVRLDVGHPSKLDQPTVDSPMPELMPFLVVKIISRGFARINSGISFFTKSSNQSKLA